MGLWSKTHFTLSGPKLVDTTYIGGILFCSIKLIAMCKSFYIRKKCYQIQGKNKKVWIPNPSLFHPLRK